MEKYLCGNTRFRVHAAEKRHKERLEEKVIGREGKTDWGKNHLEFAPKLDWCREAAVKEKKGAGDLSLPPDSFNSSNSHSKIRLNPLFFIADSRRPNASAYAGGIFCD